MQSGVWEVNSSWPCRKEVLEQLHQTVNASLNSEWRTPVAYQHGHSQMRLATLSTTDSSESLLSIAEEQITWLDMRIFSESSVSCFVNDATTSWQAVAAYCSYCSKAIDLLNQWQKLTVFETTQRTTLCLWQSSKTPKCLALNFSNTWVLPRLLSETALTASIFESVFSVKTPFFEKHVNNTKKQW